MPDIVDKLWGFCHTLRHDGIDYGDHIEQLTYLLFLKMADEKKIDLSNIAWTNEQGKSFAMNCSRPALSAKAGTALLDHYTEVIRVLRRQPGLLGEIFTQAVPRFNNPVNLKKVITLIDEEDWTSMDVDVKGAAFEGLLEKAASEGKKGAGQYFTPRVLIRSIVRVMKPDPRGNNDFRICDPACGTGGFLMMAYEWLLEQTGGAFQRTDVAHIRFVLSSTTSNTTKFCDLCIREKVWPRWTEKGFVGRMRNQAARSTRAARSRLSGRGSFLIRDKHRYTALPRKLSCRKAYGAYLEQFV